MCDVNVNFPNPINADQGREAHSYGIMANAKT